VAVGGGATRRLFVALMLGEALGARAAADVRRALGLLPDEQPPRHLRLYGRRDLHMTLFFLGAVAPERSPPLEQALGAAVAGLAAPRLELGRAGAFPERARPRVLWLGVREAAPGALAAVAGAVRSACVQQGFEADPRPFAAHVTVGRLRAGRGGRPGRAGGRAGVPDAFFDLDPGLEWQPREVALVESLSGGAPQAYRAVLTWPLASGAV
jgi:2'-5' RNA ligase